MGYKYIKCHKCYGKGCGYCGGEGIVSKKKGNKNLIDIFYNNVIKKTNKYK
jgi:hypothetical protein